MVRVIGPIGLISLISLIDQIVPISLKKNRPMLAHRAVQIKLCVQKGVNYFTSTFWPPTM